MSIREINQETWSRREHYATFGAFQFPHFNVCAEVDVSQFRPAVKEAGFSFNTAFIYLITRTANDVPEFRLRIRGETIIEHEVVHPASTVLVDEDRFSFMWLEYQDDFARFAAHVDERLAAVRNHLTVEADYSRDDMLYMTAIPWFVFTSFQHPMPSLDADSVPRFAWGKYHTTADGLMMPLSVQAHHGLMDGLHVGRYYERIQSYLGNPHTFLA